MSAQTLARIAHELTQVVEQLQHGDNDTSERDDEPTALVLTTIIPGPPKGQGSLSLWRGPDGKERAKHPEQTVMHRNLAISCLRDAWGNRAALAGAVAVRCEFRVPRPKDHWGTGRNAGTLKTWAPSWVTVPTDVDKMLRLVCDALTIAGVVRDDAQVSLIRGQKTYCEGAGETLVEVYEL